MQILKGRIKLFIDISDFTILEQNPLCMHKGDMRTQNRMTLHQNLIYKQTKQLIVNAMSTILNIKKTDTYQSYSFIQTSDFHSVNLFSVFVQNWLRIT